MADQKPMGDGTETMPIQSVVITEFTITLKALLMNVEWRKLDHHH